MFVDKDIADARGRVMRESRRSGNPAKLMEARAELAAAKINQYVREVVATAPPLTDEQIDRIAVLLRPTPIKQPARIKRVRGVVRSSGGGESE